jgi:transposase
VRRAYKFRAFPTRPQEGRAVRLLADHCDRYNAALMERREAWQMRHVRIGYGVQSAQLKEIRRADPGGQGRHSFTAQQQTLAETMPVPLPAAGREVGVDLGVARFLTTSDGELVANPRFLAASAQVIADLERRKAQARPGSGNRKRIRRALGREWRKVRNRRRDFHHKTARALVNQCDVIALVLVNPAGTSINCHRCGRRCERPQRKTVICPVHGPIDADVNGARNIASRAGLGSGQAPTAA